MKSIEVSPHSLSETLCCFSVLSFRFIFVGELKLSVEIQFLFTEKLKVSKISGEEFRVDWSAVFKDETPLYYEVAIGSGQGKTDVFGFIETKKTSLNLKKASPLQTYHFFITSINSAGLFTQAFYIFQNFQLVP